MNRFAWDLRYAPPGGDAAGDSEFTRPAQGPQVIPGAYQVRLTAGGRSYTQPLTVMLDPRSTATPADLSKQLELSLACMREMARAADSMREVRALRRQLAGKKITALDAEAASLLGGGGGRGGRGGGGGNSLSSLSSQLGTALAVAQSADRTPPEAAYTVFGLATRELIFQLTAWKALQAKAAALLK